MLQGATALMRTLDTTSSSSLHRPPPTALLLLQGIIALIGNLVTSVAADDVASLAAPPKGELSASDDKRRPTKEYLHGLLQEIYEVRLPERYRGQLFGDLVLHLFSTHGILVFALAKSEEGGADVEGIAVHPGYKHEMEEDVAFVIAHDNPQRCIDSSVDSFFQTLPDRQDDMSSDGGSPRPTTTKSRDREALHRNRDGSDAHPPGSSAHVSGRAMGWPSLAPARNPDAREVAATGYIDTDDAEQTEQLARAIDSIFERRQRARAAPEHKGKGPYLGMALSPIASARGETDYAASTAPVQPPQQAVDQPAILSTNHAGTQSEASSKPASVPSRRSNRVLPLPPVIKAATTAATPSPHLPPPSAKISAAPHRVSDALATANPTLEPPSTLPCASPSALPGSPLPTLPGALESHTNSELERMACDWLGRGEATFVGARTPIRSPEFLAANNSVDALETSYVSASEDGVGEGNPETREGGGGGGGGESKSPASASVAHGRAALKPKEFGRMEKRSAAEGDGAGPQARCAGNALHALSSPPLEAQPRSMIDVIRLSRPRTLRDIQSVLDLRPKMRKPPGSPMKVADLDDHVVVCGLPQRLSAFFEPFAIGLKGNATHLLREGLHSVTTRDASGEIERSMVIPVLFLWDGDVSEEQLQVIKVDRD